MNYGKGSSTDPAEYIVPPNFGKSLGENFHLRIQQGHHRALQIIANSGVFPFQTPQDVARWCIKFGLEELNRRDLRLINSVMRRTNSMIVMMVDEIERQKHDETFSKAREIVNGHLARGDRPSAMRFLAKIRKDIELMPNEPESELHWKMRYMDRYDEEFKYLLKEPE